MSLYRPLAKLPQPLTLKIEFLYVKADLKKDKAVRVWSIGYGKDKKFFITLTDTEKAAE